MPVQTKERTELVDIGLDEKHRDGLVAMLNTLLADEVTLYQKTRNFHWNVYGPHFHSLHIFLEKQYEELDEMGDEVAEWTRKYGGRAQATLQEITRATRLPEHPGKYPPAMEMIAELLADHQRIIVELRKDVERADEEFDAQDAVDFFTGTMEAHEKMAWMLRAHLEGPSK
jgi:starvation-inducible DNA-binding protein